ncbi:MAG: DsbA family protein, partial [Methylotetracoccus sp.]|nr:DsbA family protein [Methylotetracoccus sp.]
MVKALDKIFPTQLERHLFLDPEVPFGAVSGDYHYQSAMLRYGGEWYGGIDRLDHLEGRWRSLGLGRGADVARWTRTWQPFCYGSAGAGAGGPALDFFFSLRSPYSYLAFDRTLRLADHYAIPVRLRPVLPMVMRGLTVSRQKRMYILRDAAREARKLGIPFGRISDPVGRPVERGYALLDYADGHGRLREFLSCFFRAVWAEGVDAGTDAGLARIVERAGLNWDEARRRIGEESWRLRVEENQRLLAESGLWGVPSYRYGEIR